MKKMGKQLIAGTAMAVTAISSAAMLSGCFPFGPTPNVYGPPPDPTETAVSIETTETQPTSTPEVTTAFTETSTTYDPNPPVYGPPENFDPGNEVNVDVYGPPADFDPTSEINEDVYGPPEYFESSENIPEGIYGPPEDLGPGF